MSRRSSRQSTCCRPSTARHVHEPVELGQQVRVQGPLNLRGHRGEVGRRPGRSLPGMTAGRQGHDLDCMKPRINFELAGRSAFPLPAPFAELDNLTAQSGRGQSARFQSFSPLGAMAAVYLRMSCLALPYTRRGR